MDKYGVEEPGLSDKTAEEKTKCPKCGKPLLPDYENDGILRCPDCGTAPFER